MRIQGDLATYEFSDLLQWLAQGCKTGILTVSDGDVEYQLGFDRGRIDMSSSSDPDKRLDSYLHRKGFIDKATLERGERLREATQMKSGQVLVTLGAVTEMELAQTLRDRTEEMLCELLTWDQGSFDFAGGERPDSAMVPISLEVTKLLLESMHRLDQRREGGRPELASGAALAPEMPAGLGPPTDLTQAIDGLALAEILDPESPPVAAPVGAPAEAVDPAVDCAGADLLPPYAAMARTPSAVRRLASYVLVVGLSLLAGGFHLANIEASAEAEEVGPAGEPILFQRTVGPPRVAASQPPAPVVAEVPAEIDARETEEALRRRYEEELASLRQQLEEARRLAQAAEAAGTGSAAAKPDRRTAAAETGAETPRRAAATPAAAAAALRPPSARQPTAAAARPPVEPAPAFEAPPVPAVPETAQPAALAAGEAEAPAVEVVDPTLLGRPTPRYPLAAQRHRRGATVVVRVRVGADGRVEEVVRLGAKAGMGFDRAAEEAAFASSWEPGTRNGEPAAMWATLRFEFKP